MKAFTFAPSNSLLQLCFIAATIVWQGVPVVSAPTPSDAFYCGTDWSDATTNCHQYCPGGTDGECAEGQSCFDQTSCNGDKAPSGAYFCGTDWSDATTNCHQHCPEGTDDECAEGQSCFADTSCNGPLPSPSPITTLPTPTPPSVSARGDSRMVAFLGNWQSCPSPEQYAQYTHIVISFAVSYTYNVFKNQCSESCTIGASVPICDNRENQELVDVWQAAGKKVILSFGGAGMGGSWAGDNNNCWDYCFGKEASVVSQLGEIVEAKGFDGVDIDYEYFHDTLEQQDFLRKVTTGLRNTLPAGSIVSHAPMDSDLIPGKGYYGVMKEVASSMDFIMPQYYNGATRPAIDGLAGSGSGQMSALSHYQTLVTDMFDGAADKVIFGFCISDCSGTGSNADAQQAAVVMADLNEAYPCNGGAFFWVVEDDINGSWSSTVGDIVSRNAGCSDGTSPPIGPFNTSPTAGPLTEQPSTAPVTAPPTPTSPPTQQPSTAPVTAPPTPTSPPTEQPSTAPGTAPPTPTSPPTEQPSTAPVTAPPTLTDPASFCCSWNYKDCGGSDWCDANEGNCAGSCGGFWMEKGSVPTDCIARWGTCTDNIDGCCSPNVCEGNLWYRQCL